MKLFFAYLGDHKKGIGTFFLFSAIFLLVFYLYQAPVYAVGYACLLCACVGIALLVGDFLRFLKRIRQLELLKKELNVSLDKLPEPAYALEQNYQELLRELYTQKQEMFSESSRRFFELTEYYTIWAHQIKTPIAAMRLILQREDTTLTRELKEELFWTEQYVEMVLAELRLHSDTTDYVLRECELDALIRQVLRKYATQFISRHLTLKYEPIEVAVITDEKWLSFVLEQVLSNALKYTREGSITITLEEPLTLCIRDTGIGIAPEDLPRIFEKGYTGYNGRSDKKASGIGLYLCRRILEKLGHTITAESVAGRGTVIRIGLKRREMELE